MPPVEDHPIHPSTQKGDDFRYGCWNRKPFKKAYFAPNRYMPVLRDPKEFFKQTFVLHAKHIPHVMSTDCRYDMSDTDPNCRECKHRIIDIEAEVRKDINRQLGETHREYELEFLRRMQEGDVPHP